jgi:kumamolisin
MEETVTNVLRNLSATLLAATICSPAFASPVTAVLRLKEAVTMEQLARDVQNPLSARFGQVYTPSEIRAISAPSDADYQATLTQLQAEGFRIVAESPTHLWITVNADSSVFEQTFATRLQTMRGNFRQQMVRAQIPNRLSTIASVTGLDNTRHAHPKYIKQEGVTTRAASGPDGISPQQVKDAYGFSPLYASGVSGKGQHIAVATYGNFKTADVQYFYKNYKLSPMSKVDAVSFNGKAAYDENYAIETQLDAEFSGMMAPGAAVHVFTSATNDDAGEAQMFTAILDDNRASVVNYSWGSCESQLSEAHKTEMAKIFARAVVQGVNVMVASGDSGSDSCQDGTTIADWPAANDNVVAVGGTTLSTAKGMSEVAWSGSGGGISGAWDLPSYQKDLGAPYVKRSYPDVSFNADPASGQAVYAHQYGAPVWITIGGTSMAAPQWSGFLALVGQARAKAGKKAFGFLNPIIYALTPEQRATLFNDVTSGSNGAYTAGAGWDAVTGYGSMQAQALHSYLTNL